MTHQSLKQTSVKPNTVNPQPEARYSLVEVFDSFQGEGGNVGIPMTFVRFSKCNLACDFCDTPYNRVAVQVTEEQLIELLVDKDPRFVLFTGGEPTLQLKASTGEKLNEHRISTGIETNGMLWNDALQWMEYITISPKRYRTNPEDVIPLHERIHANYAAAAEMCEVDELRFIVTKEGCWPDEEIEFVCKHVKPKAVFFSPVIEDDNPLPKSWESGDGMSNYGHMAGGAAFKAMHLVGKFTKYNSRLSFQTHKFIGAR